MKTQHHLDVMSVVRCRREPASPHPEALLGSNGALNEIYYVEFAVPKPDGSKLVTSQPQCAMMPAPSRIRIRYVDSPQQRRSCWM